MSYNYKQSGFTLMEVIASLAIFTIVVIIVYSTYSFGQRVYRQGGNEMEIWQNARVALDRITREVRQAEDLVTELPPTDDDPLNPPASELEFQDGHDTSEITYIRYYLDGTNLQRQIIAYYFDEEPDIYVLWNSIDEFANPPEQIILEDRIVGEYFTDLDFWGADSLINITIELTKSEQSAELLTAVYGRNL